jgi:hypothetical protein
MTGDRADVRIGSGLGGGEGEALPTCARVTQYPDQELGSLYAQLAPLRSAKEW